MEGVAFAFRDCQRVLSDAGTKIDRLLAVGGGSKSNLWLKMIATNLDMELSLPEDGDFGGALGAARLGLCAATGASPEDVITMPGIKIDHRARTLRSSRPTTTNTRATARSIRPSRRPASDRFLQGDQTRQVQGPAFEGPVGLSSLQQGRAGRWASGWRTTSGPPSPTGTPSPGKAATRSAAAPSTARGTTRAWRARRSRPTSPSSSSTSSMRRSSASTTPTSRPRARRSRRATRTSATIADIFAKKMQTSRTKLLWGTANLFSNRRYMAGAATNPDPDVFAYAAGQVKNVLEVDA